MNLNNKTLKNIENTHDVIELSQTHVPKPTTSSQSSNEFESKFENKSSQNTTQKSIEILNSAKNKNIFVEEVKI